MLLADRYVTCNDTHRRSLMELPWPMSVRVTVCPPLRRPRDCLLPRGRNDADTVEVEGAKMLWGEGEGDGDTVDACPIISPHHKSPGSTPAQ
jgi:hypothetical protein